MSLLENELKPLGDFKVTSNWGKYWQKVQLYFILTYIYYSKSIMKIDTWKIQQGFLNYSETVHVHSVILKIDVGSLDFEKGRKAEKKNQRVYFWHQKSNIGEILKVTSSWVISENSIIYTINLRDDPERKHFYKGVEISMGKIWNMERHFNLVQFSMTFYILLNFLSHYSRY